MQTLLLIDAHQIWHRALNAPRQIALRAPDGRPTGSIYGFYQYLRMILEESPWKVTHAAAVFDPPRDTLVKRKIDPKYKDRGIIGPAMSKDGIWQLAQCRELCRNLKLMTLRTAGYEADDVIASICAKVKVDQIVIASTDKDLMSLVEDKPERGVVRMYDPFARVEFDIAHVKRRWGFARQKIVEMMTLTGDMTDNVRGVEGIGIKTAQKLIQWYSTADNAKHLCTNPRMYKLMQAADLVKSRKLVTLINDVKVPSDLGDYKLPEKWFTDAARKQLEALGFRRSIQI